MCDPYGNQTPLQFPIQIDGLGNYSAEVRLGVAPEGCNPSEEANRPSAGG